MCFVHDICHRTGPSFAVTMDEFTPLLPAPCTSFTPKKVCRHFFVVHWWRCVDLPRREACTCLFTELCVMRRSSRRTPHVVWCQSSQVVLPPVWQVPYSWSNHECNCRRRDLVRTTAHSVKVFCMSFDRAELPRSDAVLPRRYYSSFPTHLHYRPMICVKGNYWNDGTECKLDMISICTRYVFALQSPSCSFSSCLIPWCWLRYAFRISERYLVRRHIVT